ncbi:MAG: DUF1405 domain-containing protein [Acetobacteraceae bacterium]|nr:DUF1405 domain-containing protein [Acetobacteraceae bacterium]
MTLTRRALGPFVAFGRWVVGLPGNRAMLMPLILVNLGGSVYGFLWYRVQLAGTPPRLWVLVPDSPLSTLIFSLVLILYGLRLRCPPLEGIAYVSTVKYGLWTALVLGQYCLAYRAVAFEDFHLTASHLAMVTEALVFCRFFRLRPAWLACGLLWNLVNDAADYVGGLHAYLPAPEYTWFAAASALALTLAAPALLWAVGRTGPRDGPAPPAPH